MIRNEDSIIHGWILKQRLDERNRWPDKWLGSTKAGRGAIMHLTAEARRRRVPQRIPGAETILAAKQYPLGILHSSHKCS
jgi:hypothetical protein